MKKIFGIFALAISLFLIPLATNAHEDGIVISPEKWKTATDEASAGRNWQRVEESGTSAGPETGVSGENIFLKHIPASDLKRSDGTHPAYMKRFAEWVNRFFEKESQLRNEAENIVRRKGEYIVDEDVSQFINIAGFNSIPREDEEQLSVDERRVINETNNGLVAYLAVIMDEAKSKIMNSPVQHEPGSLNLLKKTIIRNLEPYMTSK